MYALVTLALKDLRLLVRDRFSLFWVLAFPLILALFFGSLFSSDDGGRAAMKIVVFDESEAGEGEGFLRRLAESEAIELDHAESLDEAKARVRRGERLAFVHLRPAFSDGAFAMFGRDPDEPAPVALGVDPARNAERGLLQGLVSQAMFSGIRDQMTDASAFGEQIDRTRATLAAATELSGPRRESLETLMDALDGLRATNLAESASESDTGSAPADADPLQAALVESVDVSSDRAGRPRSSYDVTFPSSIVWGLMGCATAFATSLVRERRAGTLLRLRVSPLTRAHVLAGKGLACLLAGVGASALLLTVGVVALGVRIGSPALLLVSLLAASACFTGIMMVMSVIGKTESAVAGGSWVFMMPLAMIGGGMIPLIAMPPWLRALSDFSPFKWAIFAIEGAVWRDLSLVETLPSIGILLGIAVGLFAIGVVVMRRRDP